MKKSEEYPVGLVLLSDYSKELAALAEQMHVWIIDTDSNSSESKRIWGRHPGISWQRGVSPFKFDDSESLEDICLSILPMLERHHDEFSAPQPYNVLNVIGLKLTEELKTKLREFGFQEFQTTENGFVATKTNTSTIEARTHKPEKQNKGDKRSFVLFLIALLSSILVFSLLYYVFNPVWLFIWGERTGTYLDTHRTLGAQYWRLLYSAKTYWYISAWIPVVWIHFSYRLQAAKGCEVAMIINKTQALLITIFTIIGFFSLIKLSMAPITISGGA